MPLKKAIAPNLRVLKPKLSIPALISYPRKIRGAAVPVFMKKSSNLRNTIANPSRLLSYQIAKSRNRLLDALHKRLLKPFKIEKGNVIVNKKDICEARKARRIEIMRKTRGKGLRIVKAKHDIISKVHCETKTKRKVK